MKKRSLKSLDNLPGYQYLNDGLPGNIHFAMIRFAQSEQTQRNFYTSHDYKKRILIYSNFAHDPPATSRRALTLPPPTERRRHES